VWDSLGHRQVQQYLREQLSPLGPLSEQVFTADPVQGCNLILHLPGSEPTADPILVGAHYDGVPGIAAADDNASGVAALLALAGAIAQIPARRPIWLVAFDLEEWGMLGSTALAQHLRAEQQPLAVMLSLEMLAYTAPQQSYPLPAMAKLYGSQGDYLALVGNLRTWTWLQRMTTIFSGFLKTQWLPVPQNGHLIPETRLSDHSPFWDLGYPAVMVTDTAFLRNPHYHRASDTLDSLDLGFFTAATRGLEAVLRQL
jgi:Zn-dependent M28 family amino/carboxypeptidase